MSTKDQHASVSIDKQPISEDISEQPEPQSQVSSDDVDSLDHSVANIERIYR